MEHNYHIEYENVMLRPLEKEDIEYLRTWRNDPDNTRFLRKIPYITKEMQTNWYERYLLNLDEMCFAVVERKVLNRLVGSLSLHEFKGKTCFLGKILVGDSYAHGKKVGLNASIAATRIAFEQLNMEVVNLHVFKDNFVALKVYQKAGFIVVDEHTTDDGKYELSMILKREVL